MLIINTKDYLRGIVNRKFTKISLFEIACGKGGDLLKWKKLKIKNYIGVDISSSAVKDAH